MILCAKRLEPRFPDSIFFKLKFGQTGMNSHTHTSLVKKKVNKRVPGYRLRSKEDVLFKIISISKIALLIFIHWRRTAFRVVLIPGIMESTVNMRYMEHRLEINSKFLCEVLSLYLHITVTMYLIYVCYIGSH